jgi:hypothetical protein
MNKNDKKFEKKLIQVLTLCCEEFKDKVKGFEWLTHIVDFSNITQSIKIVCVFDNNDTLNSAINKDELTRMSHNIVSCLKDLGITLKKPAKHIVFDSEENCNLSHQGNWKKRLNQQYN